MPCEDCGDDHYYGWDVMETHFLTLLAGHNSPVHEPEFAPDITRYAPWGVLRWLRRRPPTQQGRGLIDQLPGHADSHLCSHN